MMKPAWDGYFADPSVIRTTAGYFAYGTDGPEAERGTRVVPVLYSPDLKSWEPLGGALAAPDELRHAHFWAPEVIAKDRRFHMFYSAGGAEGENQRLRVAVADQPEGPFHDRGVVLLPDEPFSIDANPFQDPVSGRHYLYFAKDFFDGDHPGTGVAVVELADDMNRVQGETITVLRPSKDWQLFEKHRYWYGRVWPAWYTVEGPFVVYRQSRYWLFFSGGLWKGRDYGVGLAVADHPLGPFRVTDDRILHNGHGLLGPGHNSVVTGPDGRDYIAFHAWDEGYRRRQMFVEPLVWTPEGPALA